MKPSRILANLVGMMLFVQVILGGSATVLQFPVIYHLVWGILTFVVLIVATVYAVREYGSRSTLFRVGMASIADYVAQVVLGAFALALGPGVIAVVHLTNAFLLTVIGTYLNSLADSADKASMTRPAGSTAIRTRNPT